MEVGHVSTVVLTTTFFVKLEVGAVLAKYRHHDRGEVHLVEEVEHCEAQCGKNVDDEHFVEGALLRENAEFFPVDFVLHTI